MSAVWRRTAQLILEGFEVGEAFRLARAEAAVVSEAASIPEADTWRLPPPVVHPYDEVPARILLRGGEELVPRAEGYVVLRDMWNGIVWIQWLEENGETRRVPGRAITSLVFQVGYVHVGGGEWRRGSG